jgi:4-alpha-glucanotransferase
LVSADNALVRDSRKFEATAQELVKRRNSNPETEFSPQEEQTLEQYAQWLALETEFRKRGAALTRAGVAKGVDPARLELRQERTAAQADLLRQFNATR